MRPTRRSRSAATPQKDEPAGQAEDGKVVDANIKVNLETVIEKDGDVQEDTDVVVIEAKEELKETQNDINVATEASTPDEKFEETPPQKSTPGAGAIELNCQVCNCSFTNYHEHMNSEAHKALINHSNPKTDGQNNAEASKGSPKPNPVTPAQKRVAEQGGAPSPKRMKNQSNASTPNAAAESYHCDVCKLTILRKPDFDHHLNGKKHLIAVNRAQGKSYCDICKLFFSSVTDYNDHTESQLHKNTLTDRKVNKRLFDCKLCGISSLGELQYEQHLVSKRHKRGLASSAARKATRAAQVGSRVNGGVVPPAQESQKKWLYMCNACNYFCNQDQQFTSHMILAAHKAAVTDMKKKGLMKENNASQPQPQSQPIKASQSVPSAVVVRPPAPLFGNKPNASQGQVKPKSSGPAPVQKIAAAGINAASGPAALVKPGQFKKDVPQVNRKGPNDGPRRNMNANQLNTSAILPLGVTGNRVGNICFPGNMIEQMNPQMNFGIQKLVFEPMVNFGPSPNAVGNFGSFRSGNFNSMSSENLNLGAAGREDFRGDYRGNIRDDFRSEVRDIRSVDLGGDNRVSGFRSSVYRDVPLDTGRDARSDFRGNFRNEMSVDVRSDMRSSLVGDSRGDMRPVVRNDIRAEAGNDIRGYGSSEIRDMRNDVRGDFSRDRNALSIYAGPSGYGPNYRGSDDYRQDGYGRVGPSSGTGMSTGTGNFSSSGHTASGRFDSYMNRTSSAFDNQYSGSSRIAFMGNMSLNGR